MVGVHLNQLNWLHFLIPVGGLLVILIDSMIFLSPFLDVTKDVYVNSFFPHTARLENSLSIESFLLTYDLSDFKSRINRHLLSADSY